MGNEQFIVLLIMYQHLTQKAYLERWKCSSGLYIIDKSTRIATRVRDARRIFGENDVQSDAMEKAFYKVENCVSHTGLRGEITDTSKIRIIAEWIALHFVRNALNAQNLARDYTPDVAYWTNHFSQHHAFWQDFGDHVLITCDNPIIRIEGTVKFYIAPLGPRRCIYLMPENKLPVDTGRMCFQSSTINQFTYNNASRYCLSFDEKLHLP